jgi:hypothetical protein
MAPGHEIFRHTIEDRLWVVTIEEGRAGIRVIVNRRADSDAHPQAQVLLIGPDANLHLLVPMQPVGSWWTGAIQSENPWSQAIDELHLSIVVVDDDVR